MRTAIVLGTVLIAAFFYFGHARNASLKQDDQNEKMSFSSAVKAGETTLDPVQDEIPAGWPWHGINIITSFDTKGINEAKIAALKADGINAIRMVIQLRKYIQLNHLTVAEGIKRNLDWCEQLVQWCQKNDVVVIVNTADFPLDPEKKFDRTSPAFWNSETERDLALSVIDTLVSRFDKYPNVVAYDFFAEPLVRIGGRVKAPDNWNNFFDNILSTVRKKSSKYLIYAPGNLGQIQKRYGDKEFQPLKDNKIIYGFHFYEPHAYTHQGVKKSDKEFKYPGEIGNKYWNEETIVNTIQPAINWAKKYNKLLYVGEYSAVAWAGGRNQYLDDVMTVFDHHNIGYTFWSLNGWMGWNPNTVVNQSATQEKGYRVLERVSSQEQTMNVLEKHWRNDTSK